MSVVAISPRPYPPGRLDRSAPYRRPATPSLTITVDLAPGEPSPRLARLLELLGELATSGEGRLVPSAGGDPSAGRAPAGRPEPTHPDAVRILAGSRVVRQGDRIIRLTRIEYDLLLYLAERPHRVFTRLQLLAGVWGYEHAVARTVDVHVRRLRAKLGARTPVVTTVYGVGYRLADEARIEIDRAR